MNVVPAQVAGVRVARVGEPARREPRRPARAHDPRRLRAARRRRGLRRRRRPGDRDVRLRRRAVRARRPRHRTGQHLRRRRQAAAARRRRHRLRGRADRDRDPGRRLRRRRVRRGRPDQPGRARPDRRPCWSPTRSSSPTTSRPSSTSRSSRPGTPSASAAALGGPQSGIVLVDDMDQGLEVVNAYAAEHLEIHTRDAAAHAARVRNAGAVFVGPWSPVSLGDYCAGSNHVLPTAGCACHSSGLTVRAFTKSMHVIDYSREALAEVADHVVTLAEAEDLPGHGPAVSVRFDSDRSPREWAVPTPARGAAGDRALRCAPALADSARAAQRQREPLRSLAGGGGRHRRVPSVRPRRRSTATPTASSSSCATPWRPTSTPPAARASPPRWCGRPTGPTR